MVEFYGINIFPAETAATTGGLDSCPEQDFTRYSAVPLATIHSANRRAFADARGWIFR